MKLKVKTKIKYKKIENDRPSMVPRKGAYVYIYNDVKNYIVDGKWHRLDGPAQIRLGENPEWNSYYINGFSYNIEEFYKKLYELGEISLEEMTLRCL